jgi:uncharacterized membrane protein
MSRRVGKSAERRFVQFATRQTFNLLPPTVVARTKEAFLDTLGIMVRASSAPSLSGLRDALLGKTVALRLLSEAPLRRLHLLQSS